MARLHRWGVGRHDFLRLHGLLLVVSFWRFFLAFCLHKLKLKQRDIFLADDELGLNYLDGVDLDEAALLKLHACLLRLFDARREAAEATAGELQRFDDGVDDEIWSWQIEEDSVCFAGEIFWKAISADIAMLDSHIVAESVALELLARLLNSELVEVECEEVAGWFDGSKEVMREGTRSGA